MAKHSKGYGAMTGFVYSMGPFLNRRRRRKNAVLVQNVETGEVVEMRVGDSFRATIRTQHHMAPEVKYVDEWKLLGPA